MMIVLGASAPKKLWEAARQPERSRAAPPGFSGEITVLATNLILWLDPGSIPWCNSSVPTW